MALVFRMIGGTKERGYDTQTIRLVAFLGLHCWQELDLVWRTLRLPHPFPGYYYRLKVIHLSISGSNVPLLFVVY